MSVISFIWMKKKVWYVRNTWGLRMEIYILQLYMPKTVVPNLSRRIVILLIMSIQNYLDLLNNSGAIYYFIFWDFLAHNVNFTTKIQTSTFLLPFFLVCFMKSWLNISQCNSPNSFTHHVVESVFYPFWKCAPFYQEISSTADACQIHFVRFFLKPNNEPNLEDAWFSVFFSSCKS